MAESHHLSREGFQCVLYAAYVLQHSRSGCSQDETLGQTAKSAHEQYTDVLSKVLTFEKTVVTEERGFTAMANDIVDKAPGNGEMLRRSCRPRTGKWDSNSR